MNLRTHQDVVEFGTRVKMMRMRYDRWLQTKVIEILEEEILIPLWNNMRAAGYSDKIIEGTDISQIIRMGRKILVKVRSDYMAVDDNGKSFDVARAREFGTKSHWIEPVGRNDPLGIKTDEPKALHWITPQGTNAFSKGHVVGGIKAGHLVRDIVRDRKKIVKARIKAEFVIWKNDIFNT
jgi:hypothetical protein